MTKLVLTCVGQNVDACFQTYYRDPDSGKFYVLVMDSEDVLYESKCMVMTDNKTFNELTKAIAFVEKLDR